MIRSFEIDGSYSATCDPITNCSYFLILGAIIYSPYFVMCSSVIDGSISISGDIAISFDEGSWEVHQVQIQILHLPIINVVIPINLQAV